MKKGEVFPSKYLKADDPLFERGEIVATIKDISMETMQGKNGKENKAVMFFREIPKGLIVNKTNWDVCEKLFASDDSDDWIGSKVSMSVVDTVNFGEPAKGVRISDRKPAGDRTAMLKRYSELVEKAKALGIEGDFTVSASIPETELITRGKELKAKVEAAENF